SESAAQVGLAAIGGTLRTGVADRVQDILDRHHRRVLRETRWWFLASDLNGALPGMWIGPILHPAVFFALSDRARLQKDGGRPSFNRSVPGLSFLFNQHRNRS